LVLSTPLLLTAFTVSGGEWVALGWCVAAALVQAMFYRLSGAITHLTIGQDAAGSLFIVRTIVVLVYVPVGWFAPATSHLAFTYHTLAETIPSQPAGAAAPDPAVFLGIYAALGMLAALVVYMLLLRERRRTSDPRHRAGFEEALT
jgi:hypothetical protein